MKKLLTHPKWFEDVLFKMQPLFLLATGITLSVGLYFALFDSPADYQQGETVRIMYVHVPASWMALGIYATMGFLSALYLVMRAPFCALIVKAITPVGAAFALCSLITGSLWGKPMWGTWWVWDARLTSMFLLFILYGGLMLLQMSAKNSLLPLSASLLCVIGLLNLPIIKFSVEWWHTLHQPAGIIRLGKPTVHESMLIPLLWMAAGYVLLATTISLWRIQTALEKTKIQSHYKRLTQKHQSTITIKKAA